MKLQDSRNTSGHGVAVCIENCAKPFADGTQALGPVTLDVARGETLVLLGPSGCGKTTLLRIIAGLETPDAGGRVLFNKTDVTRVPIERRNVGMVFQSYALFPNMTVAENIGYGLKIRGVAEAERNARIAELVELTGIEGLERRRIDQLSGGQRQRVALARAVAVRPSVLLLDEPLTALDAALRERLRGELNRLLRALGITAVYVTDDQGEATCWAIVSSSCARARSRRLAHHATSILLRRAVSSPSSSAPQTSSKRPMKPDRGGCQVEQSPSHPRQPCMTAKRMVASSR
jgi:putative spermidine/putrescine transport system ATP-binding protein